MATYTSNYAWTMPEGGDPVDITVLNNNLASQDNIVHNAYMQFAPVFSSASTYAVDDVVLYANNLYKCTTAVTVAGDWDSTKWTQVKVSDIAGGGGGGGGTSDYSQLTNLPSVNGVTLLGNKTSDDLGLQDAIQIDTMPTASATYDGKIVQYVGTTTASYTHGYYYECIENSGVYSWVQTNVQPSSGGSGGGHTIVNGSGASMTARDALQFTGGLSVSDDSTNERTVVSDEYELITWTDWQTIVANHEENLHPDAIITGVPDADGDISVDLMTKLWENPSPAASFAAQDITGLTTLGDYDLFLIIGLSSSVIGKEDSLFLSCAYPANNTTNGTISMYRSFTIDAANNKIIVTDAYRGSTGATRAVDNISLIPYVIYGIKTTASVKINAIAMDVKASIEYSTSEHLIGKWIDGSDLYEKTIDFGAGANNARKKVSSGLSNVTIRELKAWGNSSAYGFGSVYIDTSDTDAFYYEYANNEIVQYSNHNASSVNYYVTLLYTKNS